MLACTRGNLEEAHKLLSEGADPCHRGEFGATPLIRAAEQGHASLVSLLVKYGSPVNTQDDNGDTALICACRMGHLDAARALLGCSASVALTNSQGHNALDAALEARNLLGRPEVSDLLLAHRTGHDAAQPASESPTSHGPPTALALEARDPNAAALPGGVPSDAAGAAANAGVAPPGATPLPASSTASSLVSSSSCALSAATTQGGARQPPVLRLRRDEWAQDRNYPHCHLCKGAFTLINRRHHCRICGLVFCEKCSSNSVSVSNSASTAARADDDNVEGAAAVLRVRVCNTCAELHAGHVGGGGSSLVVDERGPIETREVASSYASALAERMRSAAAPALAQIKTAVAIARASTYEAASARASTRRSSMPTSAAALPPRARSAEALPEPQPAQQPGVGASREAGGGSRLGAIDVSDREAGEPEPAAGADGAGAGVAPSEGAAGVTAAAVKAGSTHSLPEAAACRSPGPGDEEGGGSEGEEGGGAVGRWERSPSPAAAKPLNRRSMSVPSFSAIRELAIASSRKLEAADGAGAHGAPGGPSEKAHINLGGEKGRVMQPALPLQLSHESEDPAMAAEHRAQLDGWRELRLRQAVCSQLRAQPFANASQWQGTLELLASRAAASLAPDLNSSVNSILKIKTLPGGSRADCHYVDGLVCRLKLAHKCMRTVLQWPRILILQPPLEHEAASFSSSLEALRTQEEEHMEMIVAEMAKLKVDLLLVGGSVCFTAKEKLLKRGIALAVGVKPQVLARVARCCNTQVLLSPAQVLGATPGTCGRWRVENVSVDEPVEPKAPAGKPAAQAAGAEACGYPPMPVEPLGGGLGPLGPAPYGTGRALVYGAGAFGGNAGAMSAPSRKRVTLMYFEDCPPPMLATVVLRGGDYDEMKRIKGMLAASAFVAADLAAEASCIFDMGGTMPLPPPAPFDGGAPAAAAQAQTPQA